MESCATEAVALLDGGTSVEQCFDLLDVTRAHNHMQALIRRQTQGEQNGVQNGVQNDSYADPHNR